MEKPLKTLLVGVGGYGALYADYLLSGEFKDQYILAGVSDPFAKGSRNYDRLKDLVPIYNSMEEFFAKHEADLTIISTPIHLHYEHCATALTNDSHVLCEKPFTPTLADLDSLEKIRAKHDKILAVGFQWGYSDAMLALKQKILAGELGKPKRLKCYISWPRDWEYYGRGVGWAGKLKTASGQLVYDSVASNATAHYIQNMLYLLGPSPEESAGLSDVQVECYRANDIETFDTIAFRGKAEQEAEVYYIATHATNHTIHPKMEYEFEKGRAWINISDHDGHCRCLIHYTDGRVEDLGEGLGSGEKNRLPAMAKRIRGGEAHIHSTKTVRPFTELINAIFDNVAFEDFPRELVVRDEQIKATYVKYLHMELWDCFNRNILPSEAGLSWSKKASLIL